jgi:outer membrane protein assembly factor BamE (lipoprotein component of BamABCDE complex)
MTRPSHSVSATTVNQGRPAIVLEDSRVLPAVSGFPRMIRPLLTLMGVLVLLGGCSIFASPDTIRGNKVDAYRLKELVPGTSTQADVTALIGSPTAKASFDPNTWLYISEITHTRIARTPGVQDQTVVVLTFDSGGVLRKIDEVDQDESLPVTVVARTTPSPGTEASFLQQLFGNIGRFNAGGAPSAGVGGGAPSGGL